MTATKLKMRRGYATSPRLLEIDEIYIDGIGYHKKEVVYDHLKKYPGSIIVGVAPFPVMVPVVSIQNEKYVCSDINLQGYDNLLNLPTEIV
jgi:hypothetical protein